jgi:hypothetical protein
MKLNISKCKVLSVCQSSSKVVKYNYGFDVPNKGFIALDHECAIKDLGVWMDSNLSFNDHIHEKINIANKMLGIISRSFKDLNVTSFLLLYKCMVRTHLEYADSVFDIEKVQKRATKLIGVIRKLSYKERLVQLQLPTLKYRRFRGDMIEVFKILNGFYDANVVPPLTRNFDTRTRGNSFKLKVERCHYDIRKYSFCNRVVNVWNSLPEYVVESCSLNSFKNNLDKHWKCESFYFDFEASPTGFA